MTARQRALRYARYAALAILVALASWAVLFGIPEVRSSRERLRSLSAFCSRTWSSVNFWGVTLRNAKLTRLLDQAAQSLGSSELHDAVDLCGGRDAYERLRPELDRCFLAGDYRCQGRIASELENALPD